MSNTSDLRRAHGGQPWLARGVRVALTFAVSFLLGLAAATTSLAASQRLAPGERWQFDEDTWIKVHPDGDPVEIAFDPARGDLALYADGVLWLEAMSAAGGARLEAPRIRLRDSAARPLLFRARGDLELAAKHIDIVALKHPASWLESGGDLVFRSANTVHGDAHFLALGSIRFETPEGRAAALYSPEDPILFAQGDVSVAAYSGQSVHVLAGGSITMSTVTVTTPADLANQNNVIRPANGNLFNPVDSIGSLATVTLSNGEELVVDGLQRATIDLRAGVDWTTFAGGAPGNGWLSSTVPPSTTQSAATGASISVGNLTTGSGNNNAMILLTNRFRPRAGVSGNIGTGAINTSIATSPDATAGRIIIDSRNAVTTGTITTVATDNAGGQGGDVLILAEDAIQTTGISTFGSHLDGVSRRGGGNVDIESRAGNVAFGAIVTGFSGASANAVTGPAGDVRILAPAGQLSTTAPSLLTRAFNSNAASSIVGAGDIELVSGGAMSFPPNFVLDASARGGTVGGGGGDIAVLAGDGTLVLGSALSFVQSSTGPVQRAGDVRLEALAGGITLSTGGTSLNATSNSPDAAVVAGSGAVVVEAKGNIGVAGLIQNGTTVGASGTSSAGTAPVTVSSTAGNVTILGVNNNVVGRTVAGAAGGVTITAPAGTIATGTIETRVSASNAGGQAGRGGDVLIEGGGDVSFGTVSTTGFGAATHAGAGHLEVTSAAGNLSYSGFSNTVSLGFSASAAIDNGRAGDIRLRAPAGSIALGILVNLHSSNFASAVGATMRGAGDITLEAATGITNAPNLSIVADVLGTNGGAIVAGRAGDISVSTTVGDVILDRLSAVTHTNSGDIAHRAGNLTVTAGGRVQFNNGNALNASVQSSTGGSSAPSGSITVEAGDDILVSGSILAFNSVGSGAAGTTGAVLLHSAGGDIQVNNGIETRVSGRSVAADAGPITLAADAGRIQVGSLSAFVTATDAAGQAGRGGDVELDAASGIQFANFQTSGSAGSGGTHAGAGDVDMYSSSGDIVYSGVFGTLTTGFSVGALTTGPAGDLSLEAAGGSISLGSLSSLLATNFSTNSASSMGPGGNIRLVASGSILTSPTLLVSSEAYSEGTTTGGSGTVTISAGQGDVSLGRISTFSRSGSGPAQAAGDVSVRAVAGGLQFSSSPSVNGSVFANAGDTVGTSADIVLRANGLLSVGSSVSSTSQVGTNGGVAASSGSVELRSDAGSINAPGGVDVRVLGRSAAAAAGTIRVLAPAGGIVVGTTSTIVQATNPAGVAGRGGDVEIRSALGLQFGTFQTSGSIGAGGSHAGGGDVAVVSLAGSITYSGFSSQLFTGLTVSQPITTGPAGDVLLSAPAGSITLAPVTLLHAGNFSSDAAAAMGPGGNVTIAAGGGLSFAPGFDVLTESFSGGTLTGGGGDIAISAGTGDIVLGRLSGQSRAGIGPTPGSGDVVVHASGGALQFNEGPAVTTGVFASAGNSTGPAGLVNLRADANLVAPSSIISSNEAAGDGSISLAGGPVTLRSDNGGITVGSVTSRSSARIAASPAGTITITAPNGPVTAGTLISTVTASQDAGQAGRGGDVQVTAGGNLQAGSIQTFGFAGSGGAHAGGGDVSLESTGGDILTNTAVVTGLNISAPVATGPAGDITIQAPLGRISVGGSLFAYNAGIHPDSIPGDGGDVSLLAGLGFDSPAPFEIRSETYSQGAVAGRGGDVEVLAPQGGILLSQVFTHTRALTGDVAGSGSLNLLASAGLVEITGGTSLSAYASTNDGSIIGASGAISVSGGAGVAITGSVSNAATLGLGNGTSQGSGPVQIGSTLGSVGLTSVFNRVVGRSGAGPAGGIELSAPLGAITSGSLDARSEAVLAGGVATAGGDIVLTASLAIQTGTIDSGSAAGSGGSAGVAGSIQAQTPGTIQAGLVRASSSGGAGTITLDGNRVRVSSSVEAQGLAGTGEITITHDGNGVVPFIVGNASENGSGGPLLTADAVIAPVQSFLYSKTEKPNIRIISIDQAISGLDASSDAPTTLGQVTQFEATVQEGNNVEYTWDFGDGNSGEGASVGHVYDATGDYTVEVTATNALNSASFELQVTVTNEVPIAAAGPDQSVGGRDTVTLDGSASSDPDGHLPLAFAWTQTAGPAVTLSDPAIAMPTFAPPLAGGELEFSLVVTDSRGLASASDEVAISVAPARYAVGGSVSGLLGSGLVLRNNGGDDLPIAADGPFEFGTRLLDGSPYLVTILSQPQSPAQECEVIGASGSIAADDVETVQVSCRRVSTTSLALASPARLGAPVPITASVTADGVAPLDGQVEILADTGESCVDAGSAQNGGAADFVCQLTFATLGPRSIEARFTGSATHRDSSSAPGPLDVMRFADVVVIVDDGNATAAAGEEVAWLIEVRNDGPDAAPATQVRVTPDASILAPTWTCEAVGGAICPAPGGSGAVDATLDLPVAGGLDYVLQGELATNLPPTVVVEAEAEVDPGAPSYVHDPSPSNNLASDTNAVPVVFRDGFEE